MKITEVEEKMMERVNFFEESLSEIRAGRANPAILNKVMVEYYGRKINNRSKYRDKPTK